MRSLFIAFAAACFIPHAWAVNKCVSDEGDAVTYTDAPCATEAQPVNASRNSVDLTPADKQRLRNAQHQSRERTREVQRHHTAQAEHAARVQRAAAAEDWARSARNNQVQPIVPRAATVTNPVAPGPTAPAGYAR
ncbi:hypothetical protein FN976_15230 [Caenimonas sedimenti]|uniref:DUF4124 domain-containing protein n=1 Tax=Caenimonas sedimenti TaxID=2596921 RepID=A0A562ZP35_9BURK|nr:hypothetical protein [Caenimonas sedimenti]TWO70339.1 hypothetical protein FN976_15230 [Caenimonas sedimenti]